MKNPSLAPNRIDRITAFATRKGFTIGKTGISRITSALLIPALVTQALLLGPIRSANASGRNRLSEPIAAPAEPFLVKNPISATPDTATLERSLLSTIPSILTNLFVPGYLSTEDPNSVSKSLTGTSALPRTEHKTVLPETQSAMPNSNIATTSMMTATGSVTFDFDGDGMADVGRWHPATHEFKIENSGNGSYSTTLSLGNSSSKPVAADFNGDSKTDVAVFIPGNAATADTWSYLLSPLPAGSPTPQTIALGVMGNAADVPVAGSFGGGSHVGVFRPSESKWFIRQASSTVTVNFPTSGGTAADTPITGDFDADGTTDLAVYRMEISPVDNLYHVRWYFHQSSVGDANCWWGQAGDIPVQGDFNNDGKSDPAVYRPSDGNWYIGARSENTCNLIGNPVGWGSWGDQPAPADYDGDGFTDYAIWRPTNGVWYIKSGNPANVPCDPGVFCEGGAPYLYNTLGMAGDTAIPASYTKQIGATVASSALAADRLKPENATGSTNLYSQNFSWGTSLVGLRGRAGLDAGFGLSYNSLVWIKSGNTMLFDPDTSNVAPGFRFGFPVIEPAYYDSQKGWSYMMVKSSGGRTDFRQIAASNIYETGDSSYTQLVTTGASSPNAPVENITITVTAMDGTHMNYSWKAGAFRCSKITDRNGNQITINHDDLGLLRTVTDTLGRVITVNYYDDLRPSTVTQNWKGNNGASIPMEHTWVTFTYTTIPMNTSFGGGLTVLGPEMGSIKVLDRLTYTDGSHTNFTYNGYGQVEKIENYAENNDKLNHIWTNLHSVTGTQYDCPRFTQTKTYAQNFNDGNEVTVENSAPANSSFFAGAIEELTKVVNVRTLGDPNDLYTMLHFARSAESASWRTGLPVATEDCTGQFSQTECVGRQRWTWTAWQQDVGVTTKGCHINDFDYLKNPHVVETQVGDGANTRRMTMSYVLDQGCESGFEIFSGNALFGLVGQTVIYDADLYTQKKRAVTEYNLGTQYLSRRIIGLPSETRLYDESDALMSKVTYAYDEDSFGDSAFPTQHDNTNYGVGFLYRGNLTSTTRWNVEYPASSTHAITSRTGYNISGSPVSQTDPRNRVTTISYTDNFNSTVGNATYAYPTTITDPGGSSSTIKYRYDIGANVEARNPAPTGQTYGKTSKRIFDTYGRIDSESLYVNTTKKAYTRYEYPTNGVQSKVYSTVTDANNNNIPDAADEILTESWTNGAGMVYKARTPHTFNTGVTATWAATLTNYDKLGRVTGQSVPTEVNSSWIPVNEDNRGTYNGNPIWLGKSTEYDWKGRVTRTVNTDGTDTKAEYQGCGCAGGQIDIVRGEELAEGRRTQRQYSDVLGRKVKTETLDWNGQVYNTSTNAYNGRDQVISSRIYAGDESSGIYQETTYEFDGHGRLRKQHEPRQDANTGTVYTYFADDQPETITDARGAAKHYTYNNLGLISGTSWTVPAGSGIEIPATATFAYDNVGNRTQMTDGFGTVDYVNNSLSQTTSETRHFNETVPLAPLSNNGFQIQYTYRISGQMATHTEPFGEVITYGYDKTGRIKSIDGNRVNESLQLNYFSDAKYRAWGALKELDRSNTPIMTTTFNNRLQPLQFTSSMIDHLTYDYYADGSLKTSYTGHAGTWQGILDRSYEYDFLGRLTNAKTGAEAHPGGTETDATRRPYRMTLQYDQFGDILNQQREHYISSFGSTFTYSNERTTTQSDTENIPMFIDHSANSFTNRHDADGRKTGIQGSSTDLQKYDADGRVSYIDPYRMENNQTQSMKYDGDEHLIKLIRDDGTTTVPIYHINSTVLGEEISRVWNDAADGGLQRRTKIYANGTELAERRILNGGGVDITFLLMPDPGGSEKSESIISWNSLSGLDFVRGDATVDPFGAAVGAANPYPVGTPDYLDCDYGIDGEETDPCDMEGYDDPDNEAGENGSVPKNTCYINGFEADCNEVANHPDIYEPDHTQDPDNPFHNPDPDQDEPWVCPPGDELCTISKQAGEDARNAEETDYDDFGMDNKGGPRLGPTPKLRKPTPSPTPDPCAVSYPVFPFKAKQWTGLERKSGTSSNHQQGTQRTAELVREVGATWAQSSQRLIRAGDLSLPNGVDTPDHLGHMGGYQFDIGLFRTDGKNQAVTYQSRDYDRATTQTLVNQLQSNPNVTRIIFNDPQIQGSKVMAEPKGKHVHDNHLHVEFDDGCPH